MAGKHLKHWQHSAYQTMCYMVKHPDFQKDIEAIRSETEENPILNELSLALVKKYDLPRLCFLLIRDYVCTGELTSPQDIPAPIVLLSFRDGYVGPYYQVPMNEYLSAYPNDHVAIDITGEVQKQDVLDFINQNWKLIESKLKLVEPSRPGAVKMKQIDNIHLEVLRLKEVDNLTYRQIAIKLNLTEPNVAQILYRIRKHRGTTN